MREHSLTTKQTTEDMKIVQEEIFGPVVTISKFKNLGEAVAMANNSSYGLSAAVFTENLAKAHKVARRIQSGMIFLNSSGDPHWGVPFGGYKSSGIGRELGLEVLEAYTQKKSVHVNLGSKL
jgi:aldehyde dehydrogenase (NAD(P)+)